MLGDGILYVPTYSGSDNRLYAVDVKSCRVLWRSHDFSGPTRFKDGYFVVGSERVSLDRNCRPTGMARGER